MMGAGELSRRILRQHSKSFALAQKLLPAHCRDSAAIVYAWCRRVDDAVDELPPDEARVALHELEQELEAVYAGAVQSEPLVEAFRKVVHDLGIPKQYPMELLAGMRMDMEGATYHTVHDLWLYCYRVAGTVGLMMCHVMGVQDPRALRHAAHLGIAMQLTNICRDVVEDWNRQRVYLPSSLLGHTLQTGKFPVARRDQFARAVECLLGDADCFYSSGERGLPYLPWRCAWAVAVARLVYAHIGCIIRTRGCDVTRGRAFVPLATKLWLLLSGLFLAMGSLPPRLSLKARKAKLRALRYPVDVLPG